MPHGGAGGQPILDAAQIVQERQHIQEHMDLPIDTSQMSEQELQFHYFKMHDADNNNKLDGCELVKSLIHWHDQSNHDQRGGAPIPEAKIFKDEELVQMIDPILDNDDRNKDGFIDYAEFVQAQAAAAAKINPVPQAA
jgi:Ca2+-binding EF-hand superfamily protein